MPLELILGLGLIGVPFGIFALALAYADYQYQHRNDRSD